MLSKDIKSIVNKYWSYEHEMYNKLKKEYKEKCRYDYSYNCLIFNNEDYNWRRLSTVEKYIKGYTINNISYLLPKNYNEFNKVNLI